MSQIICAHIEYKAIVYDVNQYLAFGSVHIERDYDFFALLGGGPRQNDKRTLFPLRGMPTKACMPTKTAFYYIVMEHETNGERYISRPKAEQLVERGDAQWVGTGLITDPDYFSPSWLLTEEIDQVYTAYKAENNSRLFTVEATLAAMRLLPEARLVFWFGN